jgi:DNA-binding MarR family transcriptional regulator
MKTDSELIAKWSELVMEDGFTAIPNLLIDHLVDLQINPLELSVLIAIEKHRFSGDTAWPSNETIGQITGYSPRHVNRITNELYQRNLLNKIKRPYNSCLYDFKPLIKQLEQFKGKPLRNTIVTV